MRQKERKKCTMRQKEGNKCTVIQKKGKRGVYYIGQKGQGKERR